MSKKRDPVIAVVNYFKNTELALAQQALAMATAIVRERSPRKATTPKAKVRSRAAEPDLTITN
jgi:hypothetical protein